MPFYIYIYIYIPYHITLVSWYIIIYLTATKQKTPLYEQIYHKLYLIGCFHSKMGHQGKMLRFDFGKLCDKNAVQVIFSMRGSSSNVGIGFENW